MPEFSRVNANRNVNTVNEQWNVRQAGRDPVPAELEHRLRVESRSEILALSELLKCDLSHWTNPEDQENGRAPGALAIRRTESETDWGSSDGP